MYRENSSHKETTTQRVQLTTALSVDNITSRKKSPIGERMKKKEEKTTHIIVQHESEVNINKRLDTLKRR